METNKEELKKKFEILGEKLELYQVDSNIIFDFFYAEIEAREVKLKAQQEIIEAADEVIKYSRQLVLYSTHGEIVADYFLALEKYNNLKSGETLRPIK